MTLCNFPGSALLVLLTIQGCSQPAPKSFDPPTRPGLPLAYQMLRTEAQMKRYPFRTLQTFEDAVDLAFLRCEGPAARLDTLRAHTGHSSAQLAPGSQSVTIRLPSLLSGVNWPDQWALVGAYLCSDQPQRMTATYEVNGAAVLSYSVELPAGQWTPVLLDVLSLEGNAAAVPGLLKLTFAGGLSRQLWLDDVVIVNNAEMHVGQGAADGWKLSERGFRYFVEYPARYTKVQYKTPEAVAGGWALSDANLLTARFVSRGAKKAMALFHDARQIVDGQYAPLGNPTPLDAAFEAQHKQPGEITLPPEQGRVLRTLEGDANNDAYVERWGVYRIEAAGPRVEFVLTPAAGVPLHGPVVEVSKLPAGNVLASVEGKPVNRMARLKNGNVVMELPGVFERAVTVNVRVAAP